MIGLFFVKCQQSTKFKVKCYRCFINLKFSEFIRKKIDECSSASMSKSKRLNVFNTLVLFIIAPLLLYFFNHILVFSVGLFGFSLKVLTSVSRVTVNHFKMGGQQFQRSFIVRVEYLYYYMNFLTEIFNFSIITIIERYVLLLHSWIILLTSVTLYTILRKSSFFLHSRNRTRKSYYNKATDRKWYLIWNLFSCVSFSLSL